ncbi:hypothetical protein AGOR_G00186900 [Albula goreensis]|uniref:C2H2-type domain-containing protein n=1 Tax=Albula goreensis TaxID=1534307 RepID=A0A8T3CYK6_9TELE|nr:hypothetical protein AGOR_G00186900 [Albula goreensis]
MSLYQSFTDDQRMTENDFQVQLASIMEILVKAAVRETTKLYETGVLELRMEMAQIKQENETLKSRLEFSESVRRQREPQQAEAEQCHDSLWPFPKPSHQANGDGEEEEGTASDSVSAFKEESPEVEFVLIKQEDSDIEDYLPETSPLKQDRLSELGAGSDHPSTPLPNRAVEFASLACGGEAGVGRQVCTGRPTQGLEGGPLKNRGWTEVPEGPGQRDRKADVLLSPWATAPNPVPTTIRSNGVRARPVALGDQDLPNAPLLPPAKRCYTSVRSACAGLPGRQEGGQPSSRQGELDCTLPPQPPGPWSCGAGVPPSRMLPSNAAQGAQDGPAFQCDQCGRLLSSATALAAHHSVHTGERPYPCAQCGKAFPSLRGLNRHSQVHSSDRQHRCAQCGKSFVYQFSLTKHQLIHSGQRAHACRHCDKTFVFKSDLTIHTRMHTGETPYRCSICGKEFKHRRALNMHLQGHSGERRHRCPYCGKTFLDLGNFKRHKRIHTGEKPYSCQLCGKNFTQSAHLKKHFLTHK